MRAFFTFRKSRKTYLLTAALVFLGLFLISALAPTNINDFFMPGSQPGQSGNLETPQKCDNCHGGYDLAVEPAFNWRGSMMSQAARDPLFYACMAIANQDAPESGDLCIRCHSPAGWLEGRSVPTDGSALNNNDRESVQCDFCHKLIRPAEIGENHYPGAEGYDWADDQAYLATLTHIPPQDGNGMYVAHNSNAKRGPFVDANAKHQMKVSPFHKDAAICGTCHDVSNPVYVKTGELDDLGNPEYGPNAFGVPSETFETYEMFPVERTYSEWLNSAYNSTQGVYAPQFGGNKEYVSTCQDCHMRDVTGYGANKNGIPHRTDLPLHDMTGGNTFMPALVEAQYPNEVDHAALMAGVERARYMLQNAATMNVTTQNSSGNLLVNVEVINETGHKLPSGYPEGRRIWINVKGYDANGTIAYESGAYNFSTGVLTDDPDLKVYEIKPGIGDNLASVFNLPAAPSFHFAINNMIYFDNRIPPRGFTNATFQAIQSPPIGYSYNDGQYWDNTIYEIDGALGVESVEVTLYYQTTTKEYVEFLEAENVTNDAGDIMLALWNANGKCPPEVMEQTAITMAPAIAAFSSDPVSGYAPLTVQFTDESVNGPTSWNWDFGDGATSTEQNPTHEYTGFGTYTVTLAVENDFNTIPSTVMGSISVIDPPANPSLYVNDMTISRITLGGNRKAGVCEVIVWSTEGGPVAGATVTADYTGPTAGSASGTTNATGVAVIESRATKSPAGNWCFTVTDISLAGYLYTPGMNVVTTACEGTKNVQANEELSGIAIRQIFPNPFTGSTQIDIELQADVMLNVVVYNHFGQQVAVLANETHAEGVHTLKWDASGLPAGIYFIRIQAGDEVMVQKVIKK